MTALTNPTAIPAEGPMFTPAQLVPFALLRTPDVCAVTGMARPTLYAAMAEGMFVRPIKLGAKSSAWPAFEVSKLCAARIAGKSTEDLRALVVELTEARKHCA